ncbi:MAG: Trk system potassium transporter TrkA [Clostridia bacterium]|nr:Trk system potassium transporter TrkA [Clostridia bacterium]
MQKKTASAKSGAFRIIIVGCGKVGHTLTDQLAREGHDITIIDTSEQVIRSVADVVDVMGVCGNGASLRVLEDAGLKDADLVIAVTGSDELNLLCCTIAKKIRSNIAAIARVRNPDYSEELPYLRQQLGLSMIINPDLEAAREIARLLASPQALEISSFAKGNAELVRLKIPAGNILCGKSLMQLNPLFNFGFLVCAVERAGEVVIPSGPFVLDAGDEITVIVASRDVHRIFDSIGMSSRSVHSCMIAGGGRASYYLARILLGQKMDVKIIEQRRERCEELTGLLPGATVLCGDGGDEAVLHEEGIESAEAFAALTGIDEENILLTLFAKRIPGLKTITKINRITFSDVIDGLDLGSVVYPKHITAEMITAYVRGMQNASGSAVETLVHLFDGRVEALSFHVEKDSPVVGVPLMQLKKKDHLLIACINRSGRIFFPRGQDAIQPDDSVIVVTTHAGFTDLSDILL